MNKQSIARLFTLGVVMAGLLTFPNSASAKVAKPGCYGSGCNGKDPQTMGCAADARTLASRSAYGIRVELRYSKRCNARWARTAIAGMAYDASPFAYLGSGNRTYRIANARSVWSYMWTTPIRACGGVIAEGPGVEFCTPAK